MDLERNECVCADCRDACENTPGWYLPGEAEATAKLLGLTLLDFFDAHLTVDYWMGENIFVLRPRTTFEDGGDVSALNSLGRCSFYRDERCAIHAAKPFECAVTSHEVHPVGLRRTVIAEAWLQHQDQIVELLEREPQVPEPTIQDVFEVFGLLTKSTVRMQRQPKPEEPREGLTTENDGDQP